jgi:tyrosyl-tRNA synthetase
VSGQVSQEELPPGPEQDTGASGHGEDQEAYAAQIRAQARELARGCAQVIPESGLEQKLRTAWQERRPLRVKLGIDPSGSDLTLGHAVVLRKLRQFQDHGHVAVLIVGDFTGQIGDPTGRTQTRNVLTTEQTRHNAETYMEQAHKILLRDRLELHYNSRWLESKTLADVLVTSRSLTVARLLERDDFARRYRENLPITLMEFMYPMLQGMDSVAIDADIELGGTDQTYNNLVGRTLQKDAGKEPQIVMTLPLLRGTDGAEKMGKSLGNWISLNDTPDDQYGKILSLSDPILPHYAELCCAWTNAQLDDFTGLSGRNPMEAKRAVARRVVELYHGTDEAKQAEERFDARFRRRELPTNLPEFAVPPAGQPVDIVDVLLAAGLVTSKGEARRLLASGGIRLDGHKLSADSGPFDQEAIAGRVLQRGKLRAVRLVSGR